MWKSPPGGGGGRERHRKAGAKRHASRCLVCQPVLKTARIGAPESPGTKYAGPPSETRPRRTGRPVLAVLAQARAAPLYTGQAVAKEARSLDSDCPSTQQTPARAAPSKPPGARPRRTDSPVLEVWIEVRAGGAA